MKMLFRGWRREVTPHSHQVAPVESKSGAYLASQADKPLTWSGPLHAYGKVMGLALSGSFLIEFKFDAKELRSWLLEYVKAEPAAGLRLIGEAQAEAVIALAQQSAESDSND